MARIVRSLLSQVRSIIGTVFLLTVFASASQSAEQLPVTVVIAREQAVTETIPVVGSLAAREEVQVYPLVEGRSIEHVMAEVGKMVWTESAGRPVSWRMTKQGAYPMIDMQGSTDALISVRNLTRTFDIKGGRFGQSRSQVHALQDASFDIFRGETLSIVGESGSGKSTLGMPYNRLLPC